MAAFPPIPEPLETYAAQFDALFSRSQQRAAFRQGQPLRLDDSS